MSEYNAPYAYTREPLFKGWNVDNQMVIEHLGTQRLAQSIRDQIPGRKFVVRSSEETLEIVFAGSITSAQKDTLDQTVQSHKQEMDSNFLVAWKVYLGGLCDYKVDDLIQNGKGFEYPASSGLYFSMSLEAQSKWNALNQGRDDLTSLGRYPFRVTTIDDQGAYEIQNAADMHGLWLTMLGTGMAIQEAGESAKVSLNAAPTAAAAEAIAEAFISQ